MIASAVQPEKAGTIERLSPALDALIPKDATIERFNYGFKWVEGPVWVHAGYLLFAEIPSNRIMKWTTDGNAQTYLQPSGYTGTAAFKGPESGSNGMTLDPKGRPVVAGHAARNIYRIDSLANPKERTILADHYQGKRFNSPNDLVFKSDGSLYFTDPPYGLQTQSDTDPAKDLPFNAVFRLVHAATIPVGAKPANDRVELIIKDLTRPNGIAFSPDEKYLYIAVSDPAHLVWMRYDVKPDGTVANGKIFCDASGAKGQGGPDGIRVDKRGNLYGAGPGGVWIISPEGQHIGTLLLPDRVANCAFGGPDGKTLYITASTSIYRIHLNVVGVRP